MHIPDGYISPQTSLAAYAVMVPCWAYAFARVKRTLRLRQVPMLALGAVFSFLIMLFNIPFAGESGHAVGAVLLAILLGPWVAVIAVSLALVVQALLFADGGIWALGANCLNMALIMPLAGWGVYHLAAGGSPVKSKRRMIAAALGGYVGLNLAAVSAAVLFGIQPVLFHDAAGRALYNPYSLHIALPAMLVSHLLLFGVVEAVVTGLVVAYFQRTDPSQLATPDWSRSTVHLLRRVALGLLMLVVLSPLGLYLPAKFAAGSAWGEWSAQEIRQMVGYVPHGMMQWGDHWHGLLPGYQAAGQASAPLSQQIIWYVVSALVGMAAITLVTWGVCKLFVRRESHDITT